MKFELINTAGRLQAVRSANEHMDDKRAEILEGSELAPDSARFKEGAVLSLSALGSLQKLKDMLRAADIRAEEVQIDICAGEKDAQDIAALTELFAAGKRCVRFCASARLPRGVYRVDVYAYIAGRPHIEVRGEK